MSDYVPIHELPHYVEAFEDGRKNGANPGSGRGMVTYRYGRSTDDMSDSEIKILNQRNSAWLTGWFNGSTEWAKKNPDPRIVVIDEPLPLKEKRGD